MDMNFGKSLTSTVIMLIVVFALFLTCLEIAA